MMRKASNLNLRKGEESEQAKKQTDISQFLKGCPISEPRKQWHTLNEKSKVLKNTILFTLEEIQIYETRIPN